MLASLGFATLGAVARAVPVRPGYALARLGARLHLRVARARAAAVRSNLRRAVLFAGRPADDATLDRLVRANFESHAAFLFEWLRSSAGARFPLALEGRDHLDRALARGKGAILVTCHLGSWEVAATELARSGYPLCAVTGEQLGRLAPAVRRHKARRGITVVRPANGMRALYRQLAGNRILVLLIDGDVWQRGRPLPFLGRLTDLPWGAERLARATGAPLLPAVMRREREGVFRARIYPPVDLAGGPEMTMRAVVRPLERMIAAVPSQWCLFRALWDEHPEARATGDGR
jgi:KDO2-lipid IV(A) lauroyltransferase